MPTAGNEPCTKKKKDSVGVAGGTPLRYGSSMSTLPSPLKSPASSPTGPPVPPTGRAGVGKLMAVWKVPSPFPIRADTSVVFVYRHLHSKEPTGDLVFR